MNNSFQKGLKYLVIILFILFILGSFVLYHFLAKIDYGADFPHGKAGILINIILSFITNNSGDLVSIAEYFGFFIVLGFGIFILIHFVSKWKN